MIKRFAILLTLIPAMLLSLYFPVSAATQFNDIVAQAAVLGELDSGEILFGHNINLRHPADALSRVMTLSLAVLAIENFEASEDDIVIMTESAWEGITSRHTTLGISPGEAMPLIDLMHAAFVGGAAEACNMVAEHISGSVEHFISLMNHRAVELGAANTRFTNTYGLFDEGQYTTANDQFLIFRQAAGSELFISVAGAFRYTLGETNMSDSRRLISSNALQNNNGRHFFRNNKAGMASVTFEGGHSYIGVSESDGLSLIAVVLGSDEFMLPDESFDQRNYSEARRLFEWGYSQFSWRTILSLGDLIASAPIEHGAGSDSVILRPESEIRLLLDNDIPLDEFVRNIVIFSVESDTPLIAPVEAGEVLGEITIVRGDMSFGPIPLLANTGVELHALEYIRRQVVDVLSGTVARYIIWSLAVLILIYIFLVVRYNIIRRKRQNTIAQAKRKLTQEHRLALEAEHEERAAYYGIHQETRRSGREDSGSNYSSYSVNGVRKPSSTNPLHQDTSTSFFK